MAKKKPQPDHVPTIAFGVKPGDIVEPSFYNGLKTTMYPILKPAEVKDVRHDGIDWTLVLLATTGGDKWINARYVNFKA